MSNTTEVDANTAAWTIQVWASFLISMTLMSVGILMMPVAGIPGMLWVKGYLLMGLMFTTASTFSLAKTTRDNAESKRLRNRISAAKTDKILREFDANEAA